MSHIFSKIINFVASAFRITGKDACKNRVAGRSLSPAENIGNLSGQTGKPACPPLCNIIFSRLIISLVLMFFAVSLPAFAFDDEAHFPTILTNKEGKNLEQPGVPVKKSKIIFKGVGRSISGVLITPADASAEKKYPGILFLQPPNDSPDLWMDRMAGLAGCGYIVIATDYKTTHDAEITFYHLMQLDMADRSKLAMLGVYEGVTDVITLAIDLKKYVKCITVVSGWPPREVKGRNPAELLEVPIMLVHGAVDTQAPVSVSQYLYYNLLDLEKTAQIYVLQNTRHFYSDAEWFQGQVEFVKFFNVYLKGAAPPKKTDKEKK